MLEKKLEKIFAKQYKNHTFFSKQVWPELIKLEHSAQLPQTLLQLQTKLIGTAYETVIPEAEELAEKNELPPSKISAHLQQIFLRFRSKILTEDEKEIDVLVGSIPQAQLTPNALFFATALYNLQESLDAIKKSLKYAEQGLQYVQKNPALKLAPKIREQYAYAFDRWQLHQIPPQPQKYGTIYAPLTGELVLPVKNYQYNLAKLAQARQELQLENLNAQKRRQNTLDKENLHGAKLTPLINQKKKDEEEKLKLMPKCTKCGRPGHSAVMCGYAPKHP